MINEPTRKEIMDALTTNRKEISTKLVDQEIPTPRTDAEEFQIIPPLSYFGDEFPMLVVKSTTARQLERELARAKALYAGILEQYAAARKDSERLDAELISAKLHIKAQDELIESCDGIRSAAIAMKGELDRLQTRCAELRPDADRLDWLEAHPLKAEFMGGALDGDRPKAFAITCHPSLSLRAALDAAMEGGER